MKKKGYEKVKSAEKESETRSKEKGKRCGSLNPDCKSCVR